MLYEFLEGLDYGLHSGNLMSSAPQNFIGRFISKPLFLIKATTSTAREKKYMVFFNGTITLINITLSSTRN